jgi:hypothetical protein
VRKSARIALAFILQGMGMVGLADYLPVVGPKPLRIAEPMAYPNLGLLPPLPMSDREAREGHSGNAKDGAEDGKPSGAKPSVDDVLGATQVPPNTGPAANSQPEVITTIRDRTLPETPIFIPPHVDTAPEPLLSPQMLLPYFQQSMGTNRTSGVSVTLPLIFSPATPPTPNPPSSSATYEKR